MVEPQDSVSHLVAQNRIHTEQDSYFGLYGQIIHQRDLLPENEAKLRNQVTRAMTLPGLFPNGEVTKFLKEVGASSADSRLSLHQHLIIAWEKFRYQFASEEEQALFWVPGNKTVRSQHRQQNIENGLAIYILLEQALEQRGIKELPKQLQSLYGVSFPTSAVLAWVDEKLGLESDTLRVAIREKGLAGVAEALQLAPETVKEAQTLAHMARNDKSMSPSMPSFSWNLLENWKIGKNNVSGPASIHEKIAAGVAERGERLIKKLHERFPKPAELTPIAKEQQEYFAGMLRLVPPPLLAMADALGIDFGYTPSDSVAGLFPGGAIPSDVRKVGGMHYAFADKRCDLLAPSVILSSNRNDVASAQGTLVHEINHALFRFLSTEEKQQVGTAVAADGNHIKAVKEVMDSWHNGKIDDEKTIAKLNALQVTHFTPTKEGLFDLFTSVETCFHKLRVNSASYLRVPSYGLPQVRQEEVVSNYFKIRYSYLDNQQDLMKDLSPALTKLHDELLIPRAHEVAAQAVQARTKAGLATAPQLSQDAPNMDYGVDDHHFHSVKDFHGVKDLHHAPVAKDPYWGEKQPATKPPYPWDGERRPGWGDAFDVSADMQSRVQAERARPEPGLKRN